MSNTQQQIVGQYEQQSGEAAPGARRDDALLDPLIRTLDDPMQAEDREAIRGGTERTQQGSPSGDGPPEQPSAKQLVDALKDDILKVTDPVAFMTSAKETRSGLNKNQGNFDIAIRSLNDSAGFYEQAKQECLSLRDQLKVNVSNVSIVELRGYSNLIQLMTDYHDVYKAFQEFGNIAVWDSESEQRNELIKQQLSVTQESLNAVPEALLDASAIGSIARCITEMLLFVDAWKSVSQQDGNNASKNMAKLFLQTNERARAQLNAYGMLTERNDADATGTKDFKIYGEDGYTIHDKEEAKARMNEQGGVMGTALKSYQGTIRQDMLREAQMKDVLTRLYAGEFATEQDCIAAFKASVGGGGTSDRYQAKLEKQAKMHFGTYTAQHLADAETGAHEQARQDFENSGEHLGRVDPAMHHAKRNAKDSGDNLKDYSKLNAKEKAALLKNPNTSEQERARLEMDQKAADAAYGNALRFKDIAERELKKAKELAGQGDASMALALEYHSRALQNIAQAKMHAAHTGETTDRALNVSLQEFDRKVAQVEDVLAANDIDRTTLLAARQELDQLITRHTSNLEDYNPAQLKVPAPEFKGLMGKGQKLENTTYAKTAIDLTGPAWGVFWWMGGAEGELSRTFSADEKGGEDWTKAAIKIYAGLKANLWLVEAGVKISGMFEAQKKGCDPNPLLALPDVLFSGVEEMGRWAYADWYDLSSMGTKMNSIMGVTKQVGDSVYDTLIAKIAAQAGTGDSISQLASAITKASTQMQQLHAGLQMSLTSLYSSGKGATQIDAKAIEMMADEAIPINPLVASLQNLHNLPDTQDFSEPISRLNADKLLLSGNISKTQASAVADLNKVDPGRNNPDVKFEAGAGVEGFVGGSIGKSAGVKFSAEKVWSFKDGEGESFDFAMQEKTLYTGEASINLSSGSSVTIKLTGEPKDAKDGGGWEIGLEADVPISHSDEETVDGSEIVQNMREFFEGQSTGLANPAMVEDWIKSLPSKLAGELQQEGEGGLESMFEVTQSSTTFIKIGGSFHLASDSKVKKWAVKFGMFQKLERGSKMGSISVEKGNITTFSSEDKDKKKAP